MKIVVIGGSGLIGRKLVPILRERGHEAVSASPSSGVNAVSGAGLAEFYRRRDWREPGHRRALAASGSRVSASGSPGAAAAPDRARAGLPGAASALAGPGLPREAPGSPREAPGSPGAVGSRSVPLPGAR